MGLRYSTVTGVARDDQPDGAAGLYAETIRQIHALNPNTGVEILPPDFGAKPELVGQVFDARPEVFAHNLETVPRIFKRIRPAFTYEKSLRVLTMAREAELVTKSNLILGMGEEDHEIEAGDPRPARRRLRHPHDHPVPAPLQAAPPDRPVGQARGVRALVRRSPRRSGFKGVMAGPLVRSSYRAGRLWATAMRRWGRPIPEHLAHLAETAEQPGPPGGGVVGGPRADERRILSPHGPQGGRRQSTAPEEAGTARRQIRQVYTAAHQVDRLIGWWMLLAFLGTLVVAVGIGVLVGHWLYALVLGLPLALLAATIVMSRRAERAAYSAIEGQPGAAGAALRVLRNGLVHEQQPVASRVPAALGPSDMVDAAMVFRALGPPRHRPRRRGPAGSGAQAARRRAKKVERVAPGVPVTLLRVGDGEGQVPLRKLSSKVTRLKPVAHQGRGVRGQQAPEVPRWHPSPGARRHRPHARPRRPQGDARALTGPSYSSAVTAVTNRPRDAGSARKNRSGSITSSSISVGTPSTSTRSTRA